jgi:NADPH:quinone reductase-like Zn-dependent oxidoreductase
MEGVDLIVDQVSGKVANQNLAATKVKGRIVNVGSCQTVGPRISSASRRKEAAHCAASGARD